jgi:hypothetical protein
MAHGKDFIPSKDPAFNIFFKNVCQYTAVKTSGTPPDWPHIPQAEVTGLTSAYADWYTFYSAILKDHTRADTAAKNAARRRDEPVLRNFIQTWFRRFPDIVTLADLAAMGIPPVDSTHSHIGRPKTRPVFTIKVIDSRLLAILFWDEDTPESNARPYGMNGAVVSFAISEDGHVITDYKELTRTELATRTPHYLRFDEADRGKTVYIALQWQNESGERGDPTEIQSAVIP